MGQADITDARLSGCWNWYRKRDQFDWWEERSL